MADDFDRFELTAEHIRLLRASYVSWCGGETGAAQIDPKRPYGNSDVSRDIYGLLDGGEWDDDHGMPVSLSPREWQELSGRYGELHAETDRALQIVLATGSFAPGIFQKPRYGIEWVRVG